MAEWIRAGLPEMMAIAGCKRCRRKSCGGAARVRKALALASCCLFVCESLAGPASFGKATCGGQRRRNSLWHSSDPASQLRRPTSRRAFGVGGTGTAVAACPCQGWPAKRRNGHLNAFLLDPNGRVPASVQGPCTYLLAHTLPSVLGMVSELRNPRLLQIQTIYTLTHLT